MKEILDRINEAYYGAMGEPMMRKTQARVNWICRQVTGKKVLDVGCSQGIIPILLGREGYQVTGVDIAKEAIEYADASLEEEQASIKQNVNFVCDNFITMDFEMQKFDTIILSEVVEHINQPEKFIEKAWNLLESDGIMILTAPFGINDFIDHKRTYYLIDLLEITEPYLNIKTVEVLGKWIGVVGTKKPMVDSKAMISIPIDINKAIEQAFYYIERELVDSNKNKDSIIADTNKKYQALINENKNFHKEKQELLNKLSLLEKQNKEREKQLKEAMESLLAHISDEDKYLRMLEYNINLNKALTTTNNRLTKTKTGKMFLKYWQMKDSLYKRIKK